MAALAILRRASYAVCAQISRQCDGWIRPPRHLIAQHRVEPLEKRQLLSVAAIISGPPTVTEGNPYVVSLTASSTDPSFVVNNWIISYGDGTTHTLFGDSVADLYTYNTPSSPTYDITATVEDTEEGFNYSGSTTLPVEVDEATASLYLSPAYAAAVGQEFDVYQELSDGGSHTLSAFSIAWGDGTSDSDSATPESFTGGYADGFSHDYSAAGTYDLTATAATEQGTLTATTEIVASPVSVSQPTSGYVAGSEYDLTPTFDDPGHTLSSYIVAWGDGSADETYAASASSFGHTFAAGGADPYEVTVQAVANDGTWSAYAEADPLAAVWSDAGPAASRGDTVYLDGNFDANGDEPTAWFVDWGDGASATYSGSNDGGFDGANDIGGPLDATHAYATSGTFTISAIAFDAVGSYAAQSATLEVDEPTATFSVDGAAEFTKGQQYDLTPSFSISSGDSVSQYVVSWGDGSDPATYSGSATDLTHVYTAGTSNGYTIEATAITDYGTYTAETSVDETAPSVSLSGPDSVTAGQTATFTASFDDPNGNTPTSWTCIGATARAAKRSSGIPRPLPTSTPPRPTAAAGGRSWPWPPTPMATSGPMTSPSASIRRPPRSPPPAARPPSPPAPRQTSAPSSPMPPATSPTTGWSTGATDRASISTTAPTRFPATPTRWTCPTST